MITMNTTSAPCPIDIHAVVGCDVANGFRAVSTSVTMFAA
jgi:hypothetical protein